MEKGQPGSDVCAARLFYFKMPEQFSPARFDKYEKELERAIWRLSRETRTRNMADPEWNNPYQAQGQGTVTGIPATPSPEVGTPISTPLPPVVMTPAPIVAPVKKPDAIRPNRTGAGFLAHLIRTQQERIKATLAKAGEELNVAMSELDQVATEAVNHVKAVKQETADLKASLGLNSNNPEDK